MTESLRFYVVDDDPQILELVEALLTDAGHRVWSSASAVGALPEIIARQPDCVLIDIMMPGIDGLQLCKQLCEAENTAGIKIVMLTAKAYDADRARARELGAEGYLIKPIVAENFVRQVEELVADKIAVTFWGVRGTLPVPGPKSIRYGGNTSCVTMSFQNEQLFIFDAGTGIKELSNHLLQDEPNRQAATIFISHPHWDHINALPYFAPLYASGNSFEICGPAQGERSIEDLISAQMDGVFFPVTIREFGAHVQFRDLVEGSYNIGGIDVRTLLLSHPGTCLGYRVYYGGRSVCYVTDNELYLPSSKFYAPNYVERLIEFVRDADVLITDSTYTDEQYPSKVGWGHSGISQVVDFAHRARVKDLYLVHHDPDQDDDAIDAKLVNARLLLAARDSETRCLAPVEGLRITI